MKITITILLILAILITGGIWEQFYMNNVTKELTDKIETLYDKAIDETLNQNEIEATIKWWEKKKHVAYIFINHDIVNNLDGYLSETKGYVIKSRFDLATGQLSSAKDTASTIFSTIWLTLENIF